MAVKTNRCGVWPNPPPPPLPINGTRQKRGPFTGVFHYNKDQSAVGLQVIRNATHSLSFTVNNKNAKVEEKTARQSG